MSDNDFSSDEGHDDVVYGTTPPVHSRYIKKAKQKTRSLKVKDAQKKTLKQKMIRARKAAAQVRAVEFEIDDWGLGDVHETAEDGTGDAPSRKKDVGKTFQKLRGAERDYKHNNIGMMQTEVSPPIIPNEKPSSLFNPTQQQTMPNRFRCLRPQQSIVGVEEKGSPSNSPTKLNKRPRHRKCPENRVEFYQTFSTLIKAGRHKDIDNIPAMQRQISCEQEIWRSNTNDIIWFEIQALIQSRSLEEQDEYFVDARKQVDVVLAEIMQFKVQLPYSDNVQPTCAACQMGKTCSKDIVCQTFHSVIHNAQSISDLVQQQKDSLAKVETLLNKLDNVEQLYPNFKYMEECHPLYENPEFQRRLKILYLWRNITRNVAYQLQMIAKVLFIDGYKDLGWPWIDYVWSSNEECYEQELSKDMEECLLLPEEQTSDFLDDTLSERSTVIVDEAEHPLTTPVSAGSSTLPHSTSLSSTMSRTSSVLSFNDLDDVSLYRYYVERTLRKTGMRKMMYRLKQLLHPTLSCAHMALCSNSNTSQVQCDVEAQTCLIKPIDTFLGDYHTHTPHCSMTCAEMQVTDVEPTLCEMKLPSFKPTFLFLSRILLDVTHECLRFRYDGQQVKDPSLLSIRQLIHECKEVLLGAVSMRQYYQQMVIGICSQKQLEAGCDKFEDDMCKMLKVYFDYTQYWITQMQSGADMSPALKNALEEEWSFTKQIIPFIRGGEVDAGKFFCLMCTSLLHSISDYVYNGIDTCVTQLEDSVHVEICASSDEEDDMLNTSHNHKIRKGITEACRGMKSIFQNTKEKSDRAVGFAKMIKKDLEVAALYEIKTTQHDVINKLKETDHIQLLAPGTRDCMMFIPSHIKDKISLIKLLMGVSCVQEDSDQLQPNKHNAYLVMVQCDSRSKTVWAGDKCCLPPTAEITIAQAGIEVRGLLLIACHYSDLGPQCGAFSKHMGDHVALLRENVSRHQAIKDNLKDLGLEACSLQNRMLEAIYTVNEKLDPADIDDIGENERLHIKHLYCETLQQAYNLGFEYQREVLRLVPFSVQDEVVANIVKFAYSWMTFVPKHYERGRGVRPRWANQGLNFLVYVFHPNVQSSVSEPEFLKLKEEMHKCVIHIIGDKTTPTTPTYQRVTSPERVPNSMSRNKSWTDSPLTSRRNMNSRRSSPASEANVNMHRRRSSPASEPNTPFHRLNGTTSPLRTYSPIRSGSIHKSQSSDDVGLSFHVSNPSSPSPADQTFHKQVVDSLNKVEQHRLNMLYDNKAIGRVVPHNRTKSSHALNIRKVKFKWMRGTKIGEGRFGKVYRAVNTTTGVMMAIKEIQVRQNDIQEMKAIASEIDIIESINHPRLIKYYGVEVYREEMLIFMEFCEGGTIEEVARQGMAESMVRAYTKQLLEAVNVLHDKGIIHRDIKGANILLADNGIKLGDFGLSVRLKSATQTQPGEVKAMAGTTAFMAPEVITANDPGRASDIWSVGCVVIEMATGKRPWHEFVQNNAILYKVGMGSTPAIPESLDSEGKDFLMCCFKHDPEERSSAAELLDHAFLKVFSGEEDLAQDVQL